MEEIIDPRLILVNKNLSRVNHIIAVSSGKGGVGKSVISTTLSLIMSEMGLSVGLLDLDFYGPSCLRVLGADITFPEEEKGIIPPKVHGVNVMSIEYFTREEPLPLRGPEITNAILELLAITRWGELDYLIIDLPPGMGDEVLDVIRLIPNAKHIAVSTPSILSIEVVKRLLGLLNQVKANVLGIVLNMVRGKASMDLNARILGEIPYDEELESAIGNPQKILKTSFATSLRAVAERILIEIEE